VRSPHGMCLNHGQRTELSSPARMIVMWTSRPGRPEWGWARPTPQSIPGLLARAGAKVTGPVARRLEPGSTRLRAPARNDETAALDRPDLMGVTGHTRLAFGWSGSSIRPAAPAPGRSRQQRADKSAAGHHQGQSFQESHPPPPTYGPDHHRTTGSLTVIPQATTAANQSTLNRISAQPDLARPNWTVETRRLAVIS
jgi:hypothetical protein